LRFYWSIVARAVSSTFWTSFNSPFWDSYRDRVAIHRPRLYHFQFSFWDSAADGRLRRDDNHRLSILFLRFCRTDT